MSEAPEINVLPDWRQRQPDASLRSVDDLDSWIDTQVHGILEVNLPSIDVIHDSNSGILHLRVEGKTLSMTNWSFKQLAKIIRAPSSYLSRLPVSLAAGCLENGIKTTHKRVTLRYLNKLNQPVYELRGVFKGNNIPIPDSDVVSAVNQAVRDNLGGVNWKAPSELDWIEITGLDIPDHVLDQSTALYFSDRYVFLFLVDADEANLVKVNNEYYTRGFYCWTNIESNTFYISFFYLQATCQNRELWEQIGVHTYEFELSPLGISKFKNEIKGILTDFTSLSQRNFVEIMSRTHKELLAKTYPQCIGVVSGIGLHVQAKKIVDEYMIFDEKTKPEKRYFKTSYDFIQAITSYARSINMQDERIRVEQIAQKLFDEKYVSQFILQE